MESSVGAVVDDVAGAALFISAIFGGLGFLVSLTTVGGPVTPLLLLFAAVQGLVALALFGGLLFARPIGAVVLLLIATAAFLSGSLFIAVPYGALAALLAVATVAT